MLDSVGNAASIELPDGIQGRAWQWLYGGRGGYRVVFRARDSHLSGWTVQGCSFVERRQFINPMVSGGLGEGNTRNRVFCRSEEHTSELQSLRHLVCRLLLEKKT